MKVFIQYTEAQPSNIDMMAAQTGAYWLGYTICPFRCEDVLNGHYYNIGGNERYVGHRVLRYGNGIVCKNVN